MATPTPKPELSRMLNRSWMLAQLEHATHEHHATADADLFRVLDDPTRAGYKRFLASVYHFEYAVEARLVCADELPLELVSSSLKTGALADDLFALGIDHATCDTFARELHLPRRFDSGLDALGWMYTLQRDTLQHAALYRALVPRLRSTLQVAARYLTAHANNVYERWHALGNLLDRAAATPERANVIIDAAHNAFAARHRWFVDERTPTGVHVASTRVSGS